MSLQYATNGIEFDFVAFNSMPPIRYVIASSPRCGSNMLQRALWRTGLAGAPEEYLTEAYAKDFMLRWEIVQEDGKLDFPLFLAQLMRYRTSPNGVFGLKVHGSHLTNTFLKNQDIDQLLDHPKYILIRRQDKILQAISYALARQTGVWILDDVWLPNKQPATQTPTYNLEELVYCLEGILSEEQAWDNYFTHHQFRPLVIKYEDLVSEYKNTVLRTLDYIEVAANTSQIVKPGIQRQATSLNTQWATRLTTDLSRFKCLLDKIDTVNSCLTPT